MNEEYIIKKVASQKPKLTHVERDLLWEKIIAQTPHNSFLQPSPFSLFVFSRTYATPLAIVLIVLVGGGTTAFASNAARPGDVLFPIDRAVEDVQLSLQFSPQARTHVTQQITQERLQELREIVNEELIVSAGDAVPELFSTVSTTTTNGLSIEATVFTDVSVIKIELDQKKFYIQTTEKTKSDIIAAIQNVFPLLSVEQIDSVLTFEVSPRVTVPKDRGVVSFSPEGKKRVQQSTEAILSFLDKTALSENDRKLVSEAVVHEINEAVSVERQSDSVHIDTDTVEIRIDDNGDSKFEVRDAGNRIRVEQKNGVLRTETEHEDLDSKEEGSKQHIDSSEKVTTHEGDHTEDSNSQDVTGDDSHSGSGHGEREDSENDDRSGHGGEDE